MELIDKDAVDTVLRKLWKKDDRLSNADRHAYNRALQDIQCEIDTLEVKDVDLDSNIRAYLTNHFNVYEDGVLQSKKSSHPLSTYDIMNVAKHFFELGLKVQKGE